MKSKLIMALLLASAVSTFGNASIAVADTIWQIGIPHGSVNPIAGSAEYPYTPYDGIGYFTPTFNYYVDSDNPFDLNPDAPGYLSNMSLGAIVGLNDRRNRTDATSLFNIFFTPGVCLLDPWLIYDRYGSERDIVYLDGIELANLSIDIEENFRHFAFNLPDLSAEQHVISIAYNDGGADNGHYIDYIQMQATPVPEPGTMLLLSTGLAGLIAFGRRFKK